MERIICSILFLQEPTRKEFIERRELSGKLTMLRLLINERLPEYDDGLKGFNALYDRYKNAIHERNTLVHGRWILPLEAKTNRAVAHHRKQVVFADKALATANDLAEFQAQLEAFYLLHGNRLSTFQ